MMRGMGMEMSPHDLAVLKAAIERVTKDNAEIGRELKATELHEGTVIVAIPPPYIMAVTVWVTDLDISQGVLVVHAGTISNTIINLFDDAGKVFDNRGMPVYIFEYKGEI